jgi:zinc protease
VRLAILGSLLIAGLVHAQAPAPQPQIPSYQDLKFPPLRQVTIPEVTTATLPNGMKLYLLENHELPLVGGFALIRTGNLFDPPDKIGLAELTGEVLRTGGTKDKTGDEIDVELENVAASVESNIGETSGTLSFNCLRENVDEVLEVFKELLVAPEFRQEKLDLAKMQYRSAISRRNDSAHGIAAREFSEIVYGKDNPYGWRMEYEHLNRIQREDLIAFHKRYYFPANIMLAMQGDFSASEMKAKIEKLFAGWTYKQPAVPPFPPVTAKPAHGIFLATKNDVTQTFFFMGHLGGLLKDKDYPALEVMADILGGGFSSRLFKTVRTDLGYAYSINANWGANYNHPGLFRISGSTKSASTTDAIQVILDQLEKIRSGEVQDEELETAKQTVLNSFVFNFDRPSKTLNRLVIYEYQGYPKDFIFRYQKAVAAVSKADILRVAREYIRPKDLTIVAVGKPADFGKPLAELKLPITPIDLTIPMPKQEAAKADAASLAKGSQLLHRVQQALGGADKLAAIKDLTRITDVSLQGGAVKARQKTLWIAPSFFRQDQEFPFGKIIAYFDGKTGWLSSPQGIQPMPPPIIDQVERALFRFPVLLMQSDRDPGRTVNYTGEGTLEISDKQGHRVTVVIDEKTGLPAKQTYQSGQGSGPPAAFEETFDDWQETGGIRTPRKITTRRAGKLFSETTVVEVKYNTGIKVEDISQKP